MRAGEVLETVPGLIISQHSGEGKANQYYLRGFNLDHGTDFATTVAGVPVNMPTHAHGQGYTDVNFLIPELVSGVQFRKGPYYAERGRLLGGGRGVDQLRQPPRSPARRASAAGRTAGDARSPRRRRGSAAGTLLAASRPSTTTVRGCGRDDYRKVNGVVRYSARRRAERLRR